jgi:hypothetical protein
MLAFRSISFTALPQRRPVEPRARRTPGSATRTCSFACLSREAVSQIFDTRWAISGRGGKTIHIPADALHQFHNFISKAVRMLCIYSLQGKNNFSRSRGLQLHGAPLKTFPDGQEGTPTGCAVWTLNSSCRGHSTLQRTIGEGSL